MLLALFLADSLCWPPWSYYGNAILYSRITVAFDGQVCGAGWEHSSRSSPVIYTSASAEVQIVENEKPATITATADAVEPRCPNCQAEILDQFCPHCGEARYVKEHLALAHFGRHVVHELTHLDSKMFRTLRFLFSAPGLLAESYLEGRRSRYISPLRLYLACFALMLFVYSSYHPIYDVGRLVQLDKSGYLLAFFERQAHRAAVPQEVFLPRLTERGHCYMSASEIVEALVLAGALALLYLRQRRYFAEHLIVALYFLSFVFIVRTATWILYTSFGPPIEDPKSTIMTVLIFAFVFPYLFLSLRRAYKEKSAATWLKSAVAYFLMQVAISLGTGLSLGMALLHTVLVKH